MSKLTSRYKVSAAIEMRELPIRRVSFWLRFLNSVTFRPTGFLLLSASFFFVAFVYFDSFCAPFSPPSGDGVTGSNWLIVPLFPGVNKNPTEMVEQCRTQSQSDGNERVSIVNLRALSVCTRARALPLPRNQREFLNLSLVARVSCSSPSE